MAIVSLRWVLIDLDNTLVASHPTRLKFYFLINYFKECRKINLSFLEAYRLLKLIKGALLQESSFPTNFHRVEAALAESNFVDRLSSQNLKQILINTFYHIRTEFSAIKDAQAAILKLKSKYKLVLATNPVWPLEVTEMRLKLINLTTTDFEFVTHNENMQYIKPNPKYFSELLTKIGALPHECLMVGDNPLKDGPAQTIGITTLILNKKKTLSEQLQEFTS